MQIYTWTRVDLPPWKTREMSHFWISSGYFATDCPVQGSTM